MENPGDDPREYHQNLPGGLEDGSYPPGMDNFLCEYTVGLPIQRLFTCCAVGLHHMLDAARTRERRSTEMSPTGPSVSFGPRSVASD